MSTDRRIALWIAAGVFLGLIGVAWLTWTLYQLRQKPVQTSVSEGCRMPAETEQLVVVHGWQRNRLVARCHYTRGRTP